MKSQNERILAWLQRGKSITAIEALNKFDCFRLSARIKDLRDCGIKISKEMVQKGYKRFACYKLMK